MAESAGSRSATGDAVGPLLDDLDFAIAGIDAEGRIVSWNAASERMLGYSARDVLGTPYARLMPPECTSELRKALDKLRHGRSVPAIESRRLHRDGRVLDVTFALHPIRDAAGGFYGAHTTLQDISGARQAERRLRHSTAEIEAIVKTVLDGIVTINEHGIIESFNPAAERMFGYRAHEVIGRNVSILMPEPVRSEHNGYLERYLNTGVAHVIGIGREITGLHKSGSTLPLELAIAPMLVGERRTFVGVLHDISERKRAEQELRDLNQALHGKVRELGETLARLQRTQEQLVQSEKMASLGALVAGVAHEINTPIGICVTAASYLQEAANDVARNAGSGTLTRDRFTHFLEHVSEAARLLTSNTRRASNLIGSFKQVAVDRSSDAARRFDLATFLAELLASLRPALKRHRVEVSCASGILLENYPGALAQVLTNLLVNAAQHAYPADQDGRMTIEAARDGEHVRIEVADNGCGIAPENMKRVFDPFFTTARNRGGTGLGLHISYNLVTQALGGTINVHSEVGRGTRFTLLVPLHAPAAAAA